MEKGASAAATTTTTTTKYYRWLRPADIRNKQKTLTLWSSFQRSAAVRLEKHRFKATLQANKTEQTNSTQHVLALRNNIYFFHLGHIFLAEP